MDAITAEGVRHWAAYARKNKEAAEHALATAECLLRAKEHLPKGAFYPYVRENYPFSTRQADRLMAIRRAGLKSDKLSDWGIARAYKRAQSLLRGEAGGGAEGDEPRIEDDAAGPRRKAAAAERHAAKPSKREEVEQQDEREDVGERENDDQREDDHREEVEPRTGEKVKLDRPGPGEVVRVVLRIDKVRNPHLQDVPAEERYGEIVTAYVWEDPENAADLPQYRWLRVCRRRSAAGTLRGHSAHAASHPCSLERVYLPERADGTVQERF